MDDKHIRMIGDRPRLTLARVLKTETITIICKFCGSKDVVKDGLRKGVQDYWCKSCRRKFAGNNALPGMRVPADQVVAAVSMFYEGLSL